MPLRVAHTVASVADANAGTSYSVTRLCEALATHHHMDIDLHTILGWRATGGTAVTPANIKLHAHAQNYKTAPLMSALCISTDVKRALSTKASSIDIFHTHGLWLMPNIYPARVARSAGKPFIASPRGMLGDAALKFSTWKKRAFWALHQRNALQGAACIHATSKAECDEIRAVGLSNPIAIIPNGVDLHPLTTHVDSPQDRIRTVLSLGRIHPKKGLDQLIQAWAVIEPDHTNWRLQIIGPSENNHVAELEGLIKKLELQNVTIKPAIRGQEKVAALQTADLFVLPSLNENFALTVAESLAAGTPVISTNGAPWAGLESHKCGWWIDQGVDPLAAALKMAMALPDQERTAMGTRGRGWMERDFSWNTVASDMNHVYNWLAHGGDHPATVHTD